MWGVLLRQFKRQKKKDDSKTQFSSNLRWENPSTSENVVVVNDETNDYYIARDKNCMPCLYDSEKKDKCMFSNLPPDKILVNPDDFEILEWNPVKRGKLPHFAVETCEGYFIAQSETGELGYMTKKGKKMKTKANKEYSKNIKVLTLNYDIAEEYLTNVQYDTTPVKRNKKPTLFKNITIANNNCQPMKQQVRVDSGSEEGSSYQSGSSLLFGGTLGFKIKEVAELGIRSDLTVSETETKSETKKTDHGYTQEIEVPASSSCNLVVASSAFITHVAFTADLTRVYNSTNIRTTSINGIYKYQDSMEIKTNFEQCTKLPVKC